MVIIPSKQLAFVHIPKTGGMALSRAICSAVPGAAWLDSHDWQHARAAQAHALLAAEIRTFAIMRNPWQIFESHWLWARRLANDEQLTHEPRWFQDFVNGQASKSFLDAVQEAIGHDYLAWRGGFWWRYCDEDTIVFRYEDQPYSAISELLGCELDVRRENCSGGERPAWDASMIAAVGEYCHSDIRRFGYQPPA